MVESTSSSRQRRPDGSAGVMQAAKRAVRPVMDRPDNSQESVPEAVVPEIVDTNLTRADGSEGRDEHSLIRIALRAYQIAQERGFAPGRELDDWLQAERELGSQGKVQASPEEQFTG